MPNFKNLVYNLPVLNKYGKKLFKNDEKHTFSPSGIYGFNASLSYYVHRNTW